MINCLIGLDRFRGQDCSSGEPTEPLGSVAGGIALGAFRNALTGHPWLLDAN